MNRGLFFKVLDSLIYFVRHTWLLAHIYNKFIKSALQNTLFEWSIPFCLAAFRIVLLVCMCMHRQHFCWDWQWIVSAFAYTCTDSGGKAFEAAVSACQKRWLLQEEMLCLCLIGFVKHSFWLLCTPLSVMSAESYITVARDGLRGFITMEIRKRGFQIRRWFKV